MSTVVFAENLVKRYRELSAVNGINFSVNPQECFGFLGPNGAGKTSTMRMIYGFSPVTSGRLMVLGKDVMKEMREIKTRLGVVPQEDNLDPDLKVLQNLIVYARYFDIPKSISWARAKESLELFQLWERREAAIRELSGGMKRRLMIARALINQPQLLVLDEPTTGLDPQARHLVWQKLRLLKSQGVTMLITTHYMEEAAQLCDRLVLMDKGKIIAEGTPAELIEKHVGRDVLELRLRDGAKTLVKEQLAQLSASSEEAGDTLYVYTDDGRRLHSQLKLSSVDRVLLRTATLEDVFLKLAGHALQE
ncbi:ATP-binding cassette domain-containing protein [Candidatus Acetothermia bacterium]|nr:ATP-binding cassette domain-containing protein [Candidatus Acetothermia bacterium]MBI3461364.1 ATP-binding cassette domain-containing protein [Candidatus Acetothermia bacterium]MBI3661124.1 ATP-binding cassette domain-containing protein [Candidatus Acetothermia bacterium]